MWAAETLERSSAALIATERFNDEASRVMTDSLLEHVLVETAALIDGTSPVIQRRLKLMRAAADVLPL